MFEDRGRFLLKIIKELSDAISLACFAKSAALMSRIELRIEPALYTGDRQPHFDAAPPSSMRAILTLRGKPTLFFNSTSLEDVANGWVKGVSASYGQIALFKPTGPEYGGPVHAKPPVSQDDVESRILLVATVVNKCTEKKLAKLVSPEL